MKRSRRQRRNVVDPERQAAFHKHIIGIRKRKAAALVKLLREVGDAGVIEFSHANGQKRYLHQTSNSGPKAWQLSWLTREGLAGGHDIYDTRYEALKYIAGENAIDGRWKVTAARKVRRNRYRRRK